MSNWRFRTALSSSFLNILFLFFFILHVETLATPTDAQKNNFDFIIVGGGNAGAVLANRLTENPKHSVLLLEAGSSEADVTEAKIPFLCENLTPDTPYDWNYTTVEQPELGGRTTSYPRGHILGGSSTVNYLMYTRGSRDDFDRYAKVTKDQGWSWNNMQQYFRKNERFTAPVDGHDVSGQVDLSVHGTNGMMSVSVSGFPSPIDGRVINASSQLGGDYKFNHDYNSGNELGIGWVQLTTNGPKRDSSATSYLAPNFRARPNLRIILEAQVSRLLQTSTERGLPAFRGVEYRLRSGGPLQRATATKEVILSAGAISSPQILLSSGIGNPKALTSLGIKPLVNLPDVGENLSDHLSVGNGWNVNSTATFDDLNRDSAIRSKEIATWDAQGTGPLVGTVATHLGFMRLAKNDPILKRNHDPSAGPTSAHYEMLIANFLARAVAPPPPTGNFLSIVTVVVSPTSRGSVRLRSNNPFDMPLIDPAVLKTEFDRVAMRAAIRSAIRFLAAPAWSGYIVGAMDGLGNATSDAELDGYIRRKASAFFHPVGSASMSPRGAKSGVVDPDLRLKSVVGVRVVDASVLPFVPSAHTQAPVYVVAERAADLIKAAHP